MFARVVRPLRCRVLRSGQEVSKAERRLARGPIRADELLSDERLEARLHVAPAEELLQAPPAEERSHHRRCLDRRYY